MAKLSIEWADDDSVIIRKDKGRLTMDEIFEFMHKREQLNAFEGCLVLITFRVNADRDLPYMWEKPVGDAQQLYIIQDDTPCPICGKNTLFPQYCPECGTPVKVPK